MKVCLFFTYDMSLTAWDKGGSLNREVALYQELQKKGVEFAFFTYGGKDELAFQAKLPGIEIIPAYAKIKKPKLKALALLQTLLFPYFFRKELRKYDIYKTNQMWCAWVPLIAKIIFRKALLARGGYEYYQFLILQKKTIFKRIAVFVLSKLVYSWAERVLLNSAGG